MKRIKFVTGNQGKARVLQDCLSALGYEVDRVELPLVEPQADSVEAVARAKAAQAFALLPEPLVVDDSGFFIDGLSGFPGPYTKYALETIGAAGLLRLAEPLASRSCRFLNVLVHVSREGVTRAFTDAGNEGTLAAQIDGAACSEIWSDLWRIFIPAGASASLASLPPAERAALREQWQAASVYAQFTNFLRAAEH